MGSLVGFTCSVPSVYQSVTMPPSADHALPQNSFCEIFVFIIVGAFGLSLLVPALRNNLVP